MMSVTTSRWIAALTLFVVTTLSGVVPMLLINWLVRHRKGESKLPITQRTTTSIGKSSIQPLTSKDSFRTSSKQITIIRFLTQLGGGVLFYTAMIHMLPEVRENFHDVIASYRNNNKTIPWPCMFWMFRKPENREIPPVVDMLACIGFFGIFLIEQIAHSLLDSEISSQNNKSKQRTTSQHLELLKDARSSSVTAGNDKQTKRNDTIEMTQSVKPSKNSTILDCFLLILAFSCHSIFDGIAVGSQNGSRIWSTLIAILTHKLLITFVLCHQIYVKASLTGYKNFAMLMLWTFAITFSILSPIGVILVQIITGGLPSEGSLTVIILASISAGTLLYIVFFEIIFLSRGLSGPHQLCALIAGFVVMHFISQSFTD